MSENRKFGRQFSQNVKEKTTLLGKGTLSFFGITEPSYDEIDAWNQRRLRFTLQKFGNINTQKLQPDLSEHNYPITPSFDDIDENDQATPLKLNEKTKPTYFRGKSAPGLLNRQISLHSNLVAPIDLDTITSAGSYGYRKKNAVKALGSMFSVKKSKPLINNDHLLRRSHNISYSNQNINFIEQHSEAFFANFQGIKNNQNVRKKSLKHSIRNNLHDNFIFRLICCLMKHDKESESICSRIDDSVQYRPYFTYWMTCVQILVFIIGVSCYGFAPVGLKITTEYRKEVVLPNQGYESVCWHEYDNLWIGPRQSDLIRLGARYSPCMRVDKNLKDVILDPQVEREKNSGCCIRNDGGGCYQSNKQFCSLTLSMWHNYSRSSVDNHRNYSGLVCGQDPDFCVKPISMSPFQWDFDITKWPLCLQTKSVSKAVTHMKCEITGRPCCVGIKGECIITSPSHCSFMRGYFHQDKFLCSQVNCLSEICGMLNFAEINIPDQIYRLFTSLFLHVGIVHLTITVLMQVFFLRDFEKLMGWLRTALIYFLSGVMGNLMSAVFLPYKVEAGPSGSCFAFLGVIIIEFLKSWKLIKSPKKVLLKYFLFTTFLFIIGLLPWIDNYAHLAGLFSGILLSFVFLPFLGLPDNKATISDINSLSFEEYNTLKIVQRKKSFICRLTTMLICGIIWLVSLSLLIFQFKHQPPINCKWCSYLTCIPFGKSFCDNMDVNVTAQTPCLLFII